MNVTHLIGILTKDPEIGETAAKKKFARLSLETEEFLKIHGETKRVAQVHTVLCYNQFSLPFLEQFAKAGTRIRVSGKLGYDRNGKAEVIVAQYSGEVGPMDIQNQKADQSSASSPSVATTAKPGGGYGKMSLPKSSYSDPNDIDRRPATGKSQAEIEDDEIPF